MSLRFVTLAVFILCTTWAIECRATEYYVSPDGRDTDAGTINLPFASITRAQQGANPGDTIWLRGGTYRIKEEQIAKKEGIWAYVFAMERSGRSDAPITYQAYRDEKPVFDFSDVKPEGLRVIAFYVTGSWLRFKGFEVTGVQVTIRDHTQSECFENKGSNNIYERLGMHDGQAIGLYLVSGSNNLILNCDAYRNYDFTSEGGKGGNSDGFGCHPRKGSTGNVFRGCRAWFNSDDGYDCITASEAVTFDHCWAFYNGFSPEFKRLADGNGFKVGGWASSPVSRLPVPMPRHTASFCLAVGNKANGFYANHHLIGGDWLNNSAYRNTVNFNMMMRTNNPDGAGFDMEVPGFGQTLVDNLGYRGHRETDFLDETKCTLKGNLFDSKGLLSSSDFASLDESQLMLPRKPDGSLPDISFLHPVAGKSVWKDGFPGCFGPFATK